MNYDHFNQIHEYWRNDIIPHMEHRFSVSSFDDYLRRISFLPSCRWIQEMEMVKIARIPFAMNPSDFVKKYKDYCVTYNAPLKPEDGLQRAVYQISPTLHLEAAFWAWVENKIVNSYVMVLACYHDKEEYLKFVDGLYEFRRTGNTEDKLVTPGFMGMQPIHLDSFRKPEKDVDNHQK